MKRAEQAYVAAESVLWVVCPELPYRMEKDKEYLLMTLVYERYCCDTMKDAQWRICSTEYRYNNYTALGDHTPEQRKAAFRGIQFYEPREYQLSDYTGGREELPVGQPVMICPWCRSEEPVVWTTERPV